MWRHIKKLTVTDWQYFTNGSKWHYYVAGDSVVRTKPLCAPSNYGHTSPQIRSSIDLYIYID